MATATVKKVLTVIVAADPATLRGQGGMREENNHE